MKDLYEIVGIGVVWMVIVVGTCVLLFLAYLFVRDKFGNTLSHIYHYYILCKKIPTEKLREAYNYGYRKGVAKYRLRNIKSLNK